MDIGWASSCVCSTGWCRAQVILENQGTGGEKSNKRTLNLCLKALLVVQSHTLMGVEDGRMWKFYKSIQATDPAEKHWVPGDFTQIILADSQVQLELFPLSCHCFPSSHTHSLPIVNFNMNLQAHWTLLSFIRKSTACSNSNSTKQNSLLCVVMRSNIFRKTAWLQGHYLCNCSHTTKLY